MLRRRSETRKENDLHKRRARPRDANRRRQHPDLSQGTTSSWRSAITRLRHGRRRSDRKSSDPFFTTKSRPGSWGCGWCKDHSATAGTIDIVSAFRTRLPFRDSAAVHEPCRARDPRDRRGNQASSGGRKRRSHILGDGAKPARVAVSKMRAWKAFLRSRQPTAHRSGSLPG